MFEMVLTYHGTDNLFVEHYIKLQRKWIDILQEDLV